MNIASGLLVHAGAAGSGKTISFADMLHTALLSGSVDVITVSVPAPSR